MSQNYATRSAEKRMKKSYAMYANVSLVPSTRSMYSFSRRVSIA